MVTVQHDTGLITLLRASLHIPLQSTPKHSTFLSSIESIPSDLRFFSSDKQCLWLYSRNNVSWCWHFQDPYHKPRIWAPEHFQTHLDQHFIDGSRKAYLFANNWWTTSSWCLKCLRMPSQRYRETYRAMPRVNWSLERIQNQFPTSYPQIQFCGRARISELHTWNKRFQHSIVRDDRGCASRHCCPVVQDFRWRCGETWRKAPSSNKIGP